MMRLLFTTCIALALITFPVFTQNAQAASGQGMTWAANKNLGGGTWVDCFAKSKKIGTELGNCGARQGDTQCTAVRPVLCINKSVRTAEPQAIAAAVKKSTRSWTGNAVKLTGPVSGTQLASKQAGDAICAGAFGNGWQMAEFHDGGQWGFWANGTISDESRFWVAIGDQPGNCWNK